MTKKAVLKIMVSLLLVTVVALQVDLAEVYSYLRTMNLKYIPLIIFLLLLNYYVSSLRWKKLLIFENTEEVSVKYLTRLYFIGAFFNNFMPTSIGGDIYKIYRLGKKIGSRTHAFSATFMERFTGMAALVFIAYIGIIMTWSFWFNLLPSSIRESRFLLTFSQLTVFLGFWAAALIGFSSLRFLGKRSKKFDGLYSSLMIYKKEKSVLFWSMATSFLVQLFSIFTQYFIFQSLGVTLPVFYSLAVFPVMTLATFFIPSLNGIGVQDIFYKFVFPTAGISESLAVSASLLYHLFRLLVSLAGGVMYAFEKEH